ncbi:CMP-N-acetylneuraminate-beta-galactosamide-alpha-2,3-sialyltransferase 1-like [Polypterus senegalus]
MPLLQRFKHINLKISTLTLIFIVLTLTTVLWSLSFHDPSSPYFLLLKVASLPKKPCACKRCIGEQGLSPWFDERFNQSLSPLMTKNNSVLPEDVYRWWLRLQSEKKPADFNEVIKKLFEIVPGQDIYMDWGPTRCRKCAVVGNSGNLKGSNYGAEIDLNDFVLRMNHAPTIGYEKDVGSKTTHHFMYPESAKDLQNSTILVLVPFKTLDLQWITSALTTGTIKQTYFRVLSRIKADKDKVIIYSPQFFKYVYDNWVENHGRYPSTGMLTLMFAIHICDEVNLYGFGADSNGNWHHYWENNRLAGAFRHTGVHDADFEYNVTMLLAENGKINMFR